MALRVALYLIAALAAGTYARRCKPAWWVSGFLAFMAVEGPLRALEPPLLLDRLIVSGWDSVYLAAVAGVVGERRLIPPILAIGFAVGLMSVATGNVATCLHMGHVVALASAAILIGIGVSRHSDPASMGALVTFAIVDWCTLALSATGSDWAVVRLAGTLCAAVAAAFYLRQIMRTVRHRVDD